LLMAADTLGAPPARRPGLVARLLAQLRGGRRLTKSERAEQRAAKSDRDKLKDQRAALEMEARIYIRAIPEKLKQLGVCYKYKRDEKDLGPRYKLVEIRA